MARDTEVFVLTGLKETTDALKQFDADAVKAFNKLVNTELANAKFKAIDAIEPWPMSGWKAEKFGPQPERGASFPKWNVTKAKAGIRVSKAERRVRKDYTTSAGALVQGDAAGAIYEVAGRKSRGAGGGRQFIQNLERHGKASRGIWRAVDASASDIERKVFAALNELKSKLAGHLNKLHD